MSQATLQPAPAASRQQLVEGIERIVRRNSARWKVLIVLEGIGLFVSAVLAYLWIAFWLDGVLHLPTIGRVAAAAGLVAATVALVVHIKRRWSLLRLSQDQVALAIERRTPGGVQNRLINALQIARSDRPDHAALGQAVIEENVARINQIALEQAAEVRPAVIRMIAAGVLVAVGFAFYFWQPDQFAERGVADPSPFRQDRSAVPHHAGGHPGGILLLDEAANRRRSRHHDQGIAHLGIDEPVQTPRMRQRHGDLGMRRIGDGSGHDQRFRRRLHRIGEGESPFRDAVLIAAHQRRH